MDKIDQKIFKELDKDPRVQLTKLAKKVNVSSQVADYRIKKMLENKTILKFSSIVNLKSLGLEHYRIFFNFNAKKEYKSKDIFTCLKEKKGIYWAARIGGKYDLHTVLFVKDFEEFDNFIDEFNKTFPGLIKDYKACYILEHTIYRHKYLGNDSNAITYGYNDTIKKVDDLDIHILQQLKDNCRLSSLEISKGTKESYKTIINRIKRLEKENIILGYRTFQKSVEKKPFIILLSFKEYTRNEEKKLMNFLESKKEITQSLRMFGLWNVYVHARATNNEELQELIIEIRDKFNIINDYEIIPVFEDISINLMPI